VPALVVLAVLGLAVPGLAVVTVLGAAPSRAAGAATELVVGFDRPGLNTVLGNKFSLASTVSNPEDRAAAGVVAHLNVLSTDPSVYVDPEDWCTSRTRYLDPIPAHGSVPLSWPMQAVNSGHFLVYVSITRPDTSADVTSSRALSLAVARQRTLNAGGALPLALGGPALVGLLMFGLGRRRRHR
jgi:hypothetical protein